MPKKRTTAEANNLEQSNEGSERTPPVQREDAAKRPKLDPESDTTLQDLPLELLEGILVKVVVMEVKGLKLAKSVWKEKADLVISGLRPVCSQWNNILTTNSFRTKLHRILDSTAQTFRLEVLHKSSMELQNQAMTTLKDEVFLLCKQLDERYIINVYNRDNMQEVKEVIPLPGTDAQFMAGCNVSDCLYICVTQGDSIYPSVLRISRDEDHTFKISSWKTDDRVIWVMTVSANGSLVILSSSGLRSSAAVYNADGTLQREIDLAQDINMFSYTRVIQKSNGNLVLSYVGFQSDQQTLFEFDMNWSVVRQRQLSCEPSKRCCMNLADDNDRIMIAIDCERIQLLDSEFNLLGVYSLHRAGECLVCLTDMHYDSNWNEIVHVHHDSSGPTVTSVLTIFRFIEE